MSGTGKRKRFSNFIHRLGRKEETSEHTSKHTTSEANMAESDDSSWTVGVMKCTDHEAQKKVTDSVLHRHLSGMLGH